MHTFHSPQVHQYHFLIFKIQTNDTKGHDKHAIQLFVQQQRGASSFPLKFDPCSLFNEQICLPSCRKEDFNHRDIFHFYRSMSVAFRLSSFAVRAQHIGGHKRRTYVVGLLQELLFFHFKFVVTFTASSDYLLNSCPFMTWSIYSALLSRM